MQEKKKYFGILSLTLKKIKLNFDANFNDKKSVSDTNASIIEFSIASDNRPFDNLL